jgi:hypothetical protein
MDSTQEQHEQAVGAAFIAWYNRQHGTAFRYHSRGADPPDLVYRCGDREILLEITAAYYDADNATMLWQNARGVSGAADMWMSKDPDQKLIDNINVGLTKKCDKSYPADCVLVMHLNPDITTAEEFEALIAQIKIPADHPFVEIYVGGMFPISHNSNGGYQWWKVA